MAGGGYKKGRNVRAPKGGVEKTGDRGYRISKAKTEKGAVPGKTPGQSATARLLKKSKKAR